jgi:deazaflavin-dependent oxidoreductase (nitroreductase family)
VNTGSQRTGRGSPGTLEPVAPSLIVKVVMRPMTKMLNPLIRKLAGRPHFRMAAQVRHTGRRSGRPYMTPAGARRTGDLIMIPLTFGNQSDWSRNVRAAGGCSIRLDGQDYDTAQPEFLGALEARPLVRAAFGPLERASFTLLGIRQFLRLHIVPAGVHGPR